MSGFIQLLQKIVRHGYNFIFETGLLKIFFKETAVDGDLHDIMDILVIFGIMSPWPRKSLTTGLSWYEINQPCTGTKHFFMTD